MTGSIFLIQDGKLVSMSEEGYVTEDQLQALLADHPALLAGEQINPERPRRWILVAREFGVPDSEDSGNRWSVDHLFLDQDGVPTLVEVKRSSDTRIRREVVGQMLDYAANGLVYWPLETVRQRFEDGCAARGVEAEDELQGFLEGEVDYDEFWSLVKTNLQAGRVRLLFVADEIPSELRRVVEFLNTQMDPAEVLAVEIRQYAGGGVQSLVPRVMGLTAEAQRAKGSTRPRPQWKPDAFFSALGDSSDADAVKVARRLLEWSKERVDVWWGRGATHGSFVPWFYHNDASHQLFAVWTNGAFEFYFQYHANKPPFDSEERRRDLLSRINAIDGIELPEDCIGRRPSTPLDQLAAGTVLEELLSVYRWFIDEIKAS